MGGELAGFKYCFSFFCYFFYYFNLFVNAINISDMEPFSSVFLVVGKRLYFGLLGSDY